MRQRTRKVNLIRAYHFLKDNMQASFGIEGPWTVGETRKTENAELCKCGYHSSPTWFDALLYSPGPIACIVDVSDPVEKDDFKQVSLVRTLIEARDATKVLHQFACENTERALREAGVTDKRCWNALRTKRLWFEGEATDEDLMEARIFASIAAQLRDLATEKDEIFFSKGMAMKSAEVIAIPQAALSAKLASTWYPKRQWQRKRLAEMMEELFAESEEVLDATRV